MSCNCNTTPCTRCQNGQPCNCPSDYTVVPAPTQCRCCPNGFTFQQPSTTYPDGICISATGQVSTAWCCPDGYIYSGPTPNFPNGYCGTLVGSSRTDPFHCTETVPPIPCVSCEIGLTTDCVTYSGDIPIACGPAPGNIYGIIPGDTLTTIINKMCAANKNVIEAVLSAIGLDSDLASGLCQLVQNCPNSSSGSTIPIISSIIITFP